MGEQSKIAWCDSTVNFWSGCTKVSAGCANCYAETLSERKLTDAKGNLTIGQWGKGAQRRLHESAFKLAAKLNRKPWVCDECGLAVSKISPYQPNLCFCSAFNVTFHRRRIFSLSLGDWLDPEVKVQWFIRLLDTVFQCPDCDWLLCTKHPELWFDRLQLAFDTLCEDDERGTPDMLVEWLENWLNGHPPKNIVLLTSVENQEQADKRIPELLRIPARVRGLSCEPLLGPVDCKDWGAGDYYSGGSPFELGISWIIIGGESGNKARPCNVEWIRSLRDQAQAVGVRCFVKQLGAMPYEKETHHLIVTNDSKGGDWNEWPSDLKVREFYKP